MPLVYHSECCPVRSREMALLILEAYRLPYDVLPGVPKPRTIETEMGSYAVETLFRAKSLTLSRFKLYGFVASRDDCAFVAFRGTDSFSEWLGDGKFIQVKARPGWGKVHRGFKAIYESAAPEIIGALKRLQPEVTQLYIGGHSLGAALSTLACTEIIEETRFQSPRHYTFASPRVGNPAFSDRFREAVPASYHIMNTEDIMITEPKAALVGPLYQYAHVGIPMAFSYHGGSIAENHLLETYFRHL